MKTIIQKQHLTDIGHDNLQIALDETGVLWSRFTYDDPEYRTTPWFELEHYNAAAHRMLNPPNTGHMGSDEAAHETEGHYNNHSVLSLQAAIRQGIILLSDINPTTK